MNTRFNKVFSDVVAELDELAFEQQISDVQVSDGFKRTDDGYDRDVRVYTVVVEYRPVEK